LPEPELRVPAASVSVHMMGIGGTGVVTVSQILGTAALLEGRHVWGLDQTGLSQKGGPVVSVLRISDGPMEASKITAGGADLYLGFDLLVAAGRDNLAKADPRRTVAVVSTSEVPTGGMVTNTALAFPPATELRAAIDGATRAGENIYLDAQALSTVLFGDHMPANTLLLGAAYQAGALPLSAASIERAIRLNGAAVDINLAAFQWGRAFVADPALAGQVLDGQPSAITEGPALSREAQRIMEVAAVTGETRRLLEVRVPDLIAYQDAAYARRYVEFVGRVARIEGERTPEHTAITEAVARNLYKLMAYKDEYEVARLHLDARDAVAAEFGADAHVEWNLHPPMLRTLGLNRKLTLGAWFTPAMAALRDGKRLRGTPLDPFGRAEVRRVERALIGEYRGMVARALARLTPETHALVAEIAGLPDVVRGYERIKLDNVRKYRERAEELVRRLGAGAGSGE
jgi:indolepyruvate ferredoxin oxidoreductase